MLTGKITVPSSRLRYLALLLAGISGFSLAASPPAPELQQRISALGQLNGVALACQQMALSARLREILINQAPKEREIGEIYEQATQASFLAQGQEGKNCPDSKTLAGQIDDARANLERTLGSKP